MSRREQVNRALRERGWPEIPEPANQDLAAVERNLADQPDPRRPDLPVPQRTAREVAYDELRRRGWPVPDDAA